MSRSPRWSPAALAFLLVFGACASEADDDGAKDPTSDDSAAADPAEARDRLLASIERTRSAESMDVTLDLSFDGGALLGSQSVSLQGAVELDGSAADISGTVDGQEDAVRMVVLGEDGWVGGNGAEMRAALPDGADWVAVPADQLLAAPGFSNPGDLTFLYLIGGATDIEIDEDGVYQFDLDIEAAAEAAPADVREEVAGVISFSGDLEPEVTGRVELDDEGRVVRLDIVGVQRPGEDESLLLDEDDEIRIELSLVIDDIDEDVEVDEPSGNVVDIDEAPSMAALLEVTDAPATAN